MVKRRARGEESYIYLRVFYLWLLWLSLVISDYQLVSLVAFPHFNESVKKNKNVLFSVEEVKLKVRDM